MQLNSWMDGSFAVDFTLAINIATVPLSPYMAFIVYSASTAQAEGHHLFMCL